MAAADLVVVGRWRTAPHVLRWWADPPEDLAGETIDDPDIDVWIAELDSRPIAYIQDYGVHDWPDHHFAFLPAGARGMDILIGEADLIGRGHGTAIVRRHVETLFARGVPAIGIDPHPENRAARRAYAKAGFVEEPGGPVDTEWGLSILMTRRAESA